MLTNFGEIDVVLDEKTGRLRRGSRSNPTRTPSRGPKQDPLLPRYKSKLEAQYAQHLEMLKRSGEIIEYWYEPFSFKLSDGKRYRVDFLIWFPPVKSSGIMSGTRLEAHEVKGAWIKNRRDSLTRLAWAAQKFPFFTWMLIEDDKWRWGMSRSGYSDDCENIDLYRQAVENAIYGKRGQKFLRDLLAALDAMPVKRLIASEFVSEAGEYCSIAVLGHARGIDMSWWNEGGIENDEVAKRFGIAWSLACEVQFENDEGYVYGSETPEHRWSRMRQWVAENIKEPS